MQCEGSHKLHLHVRIDYGFGDANGVCFSFTITSTEGGLHIIPLCMKDTTVHYSQGNTNDASFFICYNLLSLTMLQHSLCSLDVPLLVLLHLHPGMPHGVATTLLAAACGTVE